MLNYNVTHLEKSCTQLAQILGKNRVWKWDARFETALAEISVADKEGIYGILTRHMGKTWNTDNADSTPKVVQMVIDYFGGLNPGQTLLTSDPDQDGLLLCAWWPWGNNATISIRLAVFADSLSDEENDALGLLFRGWFGI
ncbi:MAG: hypothetical protein FP812_20400 [Desulfobacula sp.]|nr:hypothetical protein [Desulfobacula sp.]